MSRCLVCERPLLQGAAECSCCGFPVLEILGDTEANDGRLLELAAAYREEITKDTAVRITAYGWTRRGNVPSRERTDDVTVCTLGELKRGETRWLDRRFIRTRRTAEILQIILQRGTAMVPRDILMEMPLECQTMKLGIGKDMYSRILLYLAPEEQTGFCGNQIVLDLFPEEEKKDSASLLRIRDQINAASAGLDRLSASSDEKKELSRLFGELVRKADAAARRQQGSKEELGAVSELTSILAQVMKTGGKPAAAKLCVQSAAWGLEFLSPTSAAGQDAGGSAGGRKRRAEILERYVRICRASLRNEQCRQALEKIGGSGRNAEAVRKLERIDQELSGLWERVRACAADSGEKDITVKMYTDSLGWL